MLGIPSSIFPEVKYDHSDGAICRGRSCLFPISCRAFGPLHGPLGLNFVSALTTCNASPCLACCAMDPSATSTEWLTSPVLDCFYSFSSKLVSPAIFLDLPVSHHNTTSRNEYNKAHGNQRYKKTSVGSQHNTAKGIHCMREQSAGR
jgi:hypothetical protein